MHVTQQLPVTWRNRTLDHLAARLELGSRARALYHALSSPAGVLAGLRRQGARILARIHKARSETQHASAAERHYEELVALSLAGTPRHTLRRAAVELALVIDDMDEREPSPALLLASIAASDATEAAEQLAESRLLTRADRALTEGDLAELEERKRADIAADAEVAAMSARLRRALRAARSAAGARSASAFVRREVSA